MYRGTFPMCSKDSQAKKCQPGIWLVVLGLPIEQFWLHVLPSFFSPSPLWLFSRASSLTSCVTARASTREMPRASSQGEGPFSISALGVAQTSWKKTALGRVVLNCNPDDCVSSSSRSEDKCPRWAVKAALTTGYGDASRCYFNGAWSKSLPQNTYPSAKFPLRDCPLLFSSQFHSQQILNTKGSECAKCLFNVVFRW